MRKEESETGHWWGNGAERGRQRREREKELKFNEGARGELSYG